MRTKWILLLLWSLLTAVGCAAETGETEGPTQPPTTEADTAAAEGKVLVVYYSHTNNTRTIAEYIHGRVKSDLVEIKTTTPYTDDYDTLLAQVREEVATGYCPPLDTRIDNLDEYDVVFVGYPIWVETAAPPMRSFLTTHNLAGKTVVPFCTSGTSSAAASYRLVRSLCPESTVLEGIQIRRGTYDTANERVDRWLEQLGINQSAQ